MRVDVVEAAGGGDDTDPRASTLRTIDLIEKESAGEPQATVSRVDALGVFARVWLERLPLLGDSASGGRLQLRSLDGVFDDERGPAVLAQLARLEALLLAIALERGAPARRVRLAELVLTMLDGAGHRAETSPGFGDPFDIAHACRHLAEIDLEDTWAPPHLPYVTPARTCADAWTAPEGLVDRISGEQVDLANGLVVVLGASRLGVAEEAVRSAKPGEQVALAVVTVDPEETGRLVRHRVTDAVGCLRRVFAPEVWQHVRLVLDDDALVASAIGVTDPGNDTESELESELIDLAVAGLVTHHKGFGGWALTESGRSADTARIEAELDSAGTRPVLAEAFDASLVLNPELLDLCTAWQIRSTDGVTTVNDHSDTDYDARVLALFSDFHARDVVVITALAAAASRFGRYDTRLSEALDRAQAGERERLADIIDSYHAIWAELHEDLLATPWGSRDGWVRRLSGALGEPPEVVGGKAHVLVLPRSATSGR